MLNELGLGDSNTENKSNDSNDTVNDQDNDMSTGQVSEINEFQSDLIDREGDVEEDSDKEKNQNVIESNEKTNENQEVEDDIIYIETVEATDTYFVNCGASTSRGRGTS